MKKLIAILFFLFILIIFSCTPEKRFVYLQENIQNGLKTQNAKAKETSEYMIKPNDVLYIKTISVDKESALPINLDNNYNTSTSDIGTYLNSYNVSDSGCINLSIIGKIKVDGLTISQCQELIQKMVNQYLINSIVVVKLINFDITMLGEVNRPGVYKIYDTKINILEVFGLSGDLTINGNRKKIMLIRQTLPNKVAYIDLTDINLIYSDYYYLQPGDIIYVKPNKAKYYATNPFPFTTFLSTLGTISSAVATVILYLNYLKK